jgi:hypothetical protein
MPPKKAQSRPVGPSFGLLPNAQQIAVIAATRGTIVNFFNKNSSGASSSSSSAASNTVSPAVTDVHESEVCRLEVLKLLWLILLVFQDNQPDLEELKHSNSSQGTGCRLLEIKPNSHELVADLQCKQQCGWQALR